MTVSVVVYQSESVCVCVLCRHLHRDVIPYWECNIYASNLIKGWKKWLPNFAPTHTWCVWWSMSQCVNSTMRDSCMAHAWLCMTPSLRLCRIVQNCQVCCLGNSILLYSSGSIPSMWSHKVSQCFAIIHATQELEVPAAQKAGSILNPLYAFRRPNVFVVVVLALNQGKQFVNFSLWSIYSS